jgi:hypothetical protein
MKKDIKELNVFVGHKGPSAEICGEISKDFFLFHFFKVQLFAIQKNCNTSRKKESFLPFSILLTICKSAR